MVEISLLLRLATERDEEVITSLIDEAADWLRGKDTDQWAEPWPTVAERQQRIVTALQARRTWILWEGHLPAATLTAEPDHTQGNGLVWPEEVREDPAVYVARLVVRRSCAGRGLGAALLDWAGHTARQAWGAQWVRVDVWTTNLALHAYYKAQGFDFYRYSEKADVYPSAALFQKRTDQISLTEPPIFREHSADG
jgi:ribosomal protein S18 acetylase RimI-like enzyme